MTEQKYKKYIYRKNNILSVEINMARVSVNEELLTNLLDFKLSHLKEEIDRILSKWKYTSSTEFLKQAKDGTLSEAEMDAIELINLNDERERLLGEKTSFIRDIN